MVAAECRKYVNPDLFREEERILQEISQGMTSDAAALSSSLAAAEASGSVDSPPDAVTSSSLSLPTGNDVVPTSDPVTIPPATGDSTTTSTSSTTTSTPGPVVNFRRKIGGVGFMSTASI